MAYIGSISIVQLPIELLKIPVDAGLAFPPTADNIRLLSSKDLQANRTEAPNDPNKKISRYSFPYKTRDIIISQENIMKIIKIKLKRITTVVHLMPTRLASNSPPRKTKNRKDHSEGLEKIRQGNICIGSYWWTLLTNKYRYNSLYHGPEFLVFPRQPLLFSRYNIRANMHPRIPRGGWSFCK